MMVMAVTTSATDLHGNDDVDNGVFFARVFRSIIINLAEDHNPVLEFFAILSLNITYWVSKFWMLFISVRRLRFSRALTYFSLQILNIFYFIKY